MTENKNKHRGKLNDFSDQHFLNHPIKIKKPTVKYEQVLFFFSIYLINNHENKTATIYEPMMNPIYEAFY